VLRGRSTHCNLQANAYTKPSQRSRTVKPMVTPRATLSNASLISLPLAHDLYSHQDSKNGSTNKNDLCSNVPHAVQRFDPRPISVTKPAHLLFFYHRQEDLDPRFNIICYSPSFKGIGCVNDRECQDKNRIREDKKIQVVLYACRTHCQESGQ